MKECEERDKSLHDVRRPTPSPAGNAGYDARVTAEPALDCTAVILAGGQSRRFGTDKARYRARPGGPTLLERAAEPLQVCTERLVIGAHELPGWQAVSDDAPGFGPLGGLVTALRRATRPKMLVTACDLPNLTRAFWLWLAELDGELIVPVGADGRLQPLAAVWPVSALSALEARLSAQELSLHSAVRALAGQGVHVFEAPQNVWAAQFGPDLLLNVNTLDDVSGVHDG